MKKVINVFLAVVITLFSIPLNGLNVSAEGNIYDDIKDGEYTLDVKFLADGTNEDSMAANFLSDKATLEVTDGTYKLILFSPKNPALEVQFSQFDINGANGEIKKTDEGDYFVFILNQLTEDYEAVITYEIPGLKHENVPMDIKLFGIGELPKNESAVEPEPEPEDSNPNPEPNPNPNPNPDPDTKPEPEPDLDVRQVGNILSENEADAVYEINFDSTSNSTKSNLKNPVKLLEIGNKKYIQIEVDGVEYFRSLKFNGEEVLWNSIDKEDTNIIQYEIKSSSLPKSKETGLDVSMVIATPMGTMPHKDIKLWFESIDHRKTEGFIEENYATDIQEYEFDTDSNATSRQLLNPVKVIEFEGDKYLQIPVSTGGAGFFKSLKFNGEEVVWNSTTEPPYVIQYKLDGKLEDKIDVSMIIDTPMGIMPHSGIKLWLANTISNIDLGKEVKVKANDRMKIADSENSLKTPEGLPSDVKLTVESKTEDFKRFGNIGELEIAGEIYDFKFSNLPDNPGEFELTLAFDKDKYPTEEYDVDIYYFDEEKQEWIPQNGTVSDGKVSVTVNHFSIYGVFAVEKEEVEEPEDPEQPKGQEEVKYTIDYVIYKVKAKDEDKDEESLANGFFVKPGILIERDGKTYFQAKVTSWDMIESLTYNGKNVKIVSENKKQNSAVIEMEITGDLSDEILLGMSLYYGSQPVSHNARLILDPDSKKLIENDDDVGSGGKGGQTPLIPGGGRGTEGQTNAAEKSDQIQADRVFKFNYVIYKADANEPSAADQFFVKPGYLLEKNDKQYIQLYINGWNFMNWLKLKETNKHVDVVKVEGNRALIQFEYKGDLSEEIWLVMNLTVPGVYDKETYEARMVIDQASIEEIDPEGHYIYLAKPDFGDAEKDEKAGAKNTTNNPKTGDTSQVLFYTVLLIASLIALVYQVRKQLATSA